MTTVSMISYERGEHCFKKLFRFPLHVMQHIGVPTQIPAKIYISWLKECDFHKIQKYSDQN